MPSIFKCQALVSQHLIDTYSLQTKPSPIYHDSTQRTCQKESHRVYTLQDAYLEWTLTKPLKKAIRGKEGKGGDSQCHPSGQQD
jgi:hypothetical protein